MKFVANVQLQLADLQLCKCIKSYDLNGMRAPTGSKLLNEKNATSTFKTTDHGMNGATLDMQGSGCSASKKYCKSNP